MVKITRMTAIFIVLIIVGATASGAAVYYLTKPPEPIKLTVWAPKHFIDAFNDKLKLMVFEWAALKEAELKRPIEVEVIFIPWAEIIPKWLAAIEAKTTPDVSEIGTGHPAWFAKLGALLEVTDVIKDIGEDKFFRSALESVKWDGKYWAVPYGYEPYFAYWRMDLLRAAGFERPPETWDEFVVVAKALTKDVDGDGTIDYWGAGITLGRCWDGLHNFETIWWSFGGGVAAEDGKTLIFDSPQTRAALKFLADLYLVHKVIPPESVEWTDADNNIIYQKGAAAFIMNPGSVLEWLRKNRPKDPFTGADIFENTWVGPPPAGPDGRRYFTGINSLAIFKYTKYPELAKDLVKYIMKPENHLAHLKTAGGFRFPVYPALAEDPFFKTDRWYLAVLESLKYAYANWPGPPTATYAEVGAKYIINDMILNVVVYGWSVESAVKEAYAKIVEIYKATPP